MTALPRARVSIFGGRRMTALLRALPAAVALFGLASKAGVAMAQSPTPWDGAYVGVSAGAAASNSACRNWASAGASNVSAASAFSYQSCAGDGFIGGLQAGDNFQTKRFMWGLGADLDAWSDRNRNPSLKYLGAVPPPGTYAISGKVGPNDFAVLGPHIGYAGDLMLPYLTVGAIITTGARNSTLSYTPIGAAKAAASFSGGRNVAAAGWVAGGGIEIGLNGAWSIKADYLHMNLGKGSNSIAACSGAASACAAFSGITLDTMSTGFTANLFRVGINYWFDYWNP
jgi:outer membrane immunogenic protein